MDNIFIMLTLFMPIYASSTRVHRCKNSLGRILMNKNEQTKKAGGLNFSLSVDFILPQSCGGCAEKSIDGPARNARQRKRRSHRRTGGLKDTRPLSKLLLLNFLLLSITTF